MHNIIKLIIVISVSLFPCLISAQNMLSGTVLDTNGKALSGVKVFNSKGSQQTESGANGEFQISATVGDRIVLEKKGFLVDEVYFRAAAETFTLQSDPSDKLVNTGLLDEKKRAITSGISVLSGDQMRKSSVTNPSHSLYGLVPGLIVENKTGEFGNYSPNFFIRGRATMGSASNIPLVFIDGFERSMDDLSLEDIASVSVLKDAAATAIYGMRGANGVILINTHRGNEGKIKFNVNFEQGFQTPFRMPEFVNSGTYATMYNQALKNDNMPTLYDKATIDGYNAGHSYLYPDNQWQDLLVKSVAPSSEMNISASGGNKITRYYVSLGYMHNTGLFDRTDEESSKYTTEAKYDKLNFRTNLDIVAINNLDLKIDVAGMIMERNMPRIATSSIWNRLYSYPQHEFPMYLPNGHLGGTASFQENPMGYINNSGYRKIQDRFIQSNISGKYNLQGALKGFSVGGNYAYDNGWYVRQLFTKTFSVQEILGENADGTPIYSGLIGADKQLSYSIGEDSQNRRESFEGFIGFDKTIGNRHDFNMKVLYHQDKLITGASEPIGTQYVAGVFNYSLDSKYLAGISASYSGSEAFAEKYRFTLFPAVSLGWIVSDENFMKANKAVNFLKLRTSAGIVGNSNLGSDARFSYMYNTSTSNNNYYFGSTPGGLVGRKPSRIPNPSMKPEKAFKFDFGVEAQLFNSLDVSANYFFENRYDILTNPSAEISSVLGIAMANVNSGKTSTHGIEAGITYRKKLSADWSFSSNLNFVFFKDKVKEKMETVLPENSAYQYHVGHSIGSNLGLVALGLFQSQEEIDNSPLQMFGQYQPGDIKYKDVNEDGVVDEYDRVYDDGYSIPNMDLGWNLGIQWKGFDLSALLHLQTGKDIYLGDASTLAWAFNSGVYRLPQWIADRNPWTVETATTADYPRLTTTGSSNNFRRSSYWIVNGDNLRLKQLELGYTVPQSLSKKMAISNLRFYVRGMNLLLFDNLKFTDPAALGGDPMLRSYYIGFNIKI